MISAMVQGQNIYCSDQEYCPEGLARMFTINFNDAKNSSMCGAFLIAPDLVMTNSHCLWAGKISLEKTCQGLYFSFPTLLGPTENARCQKILWRAPGTHGQKTFTPGYNDFALVKLDRKMTVSPLKLQEDISKGDVVYPLVTDHLNGFEARITKLECGVKKIDKYGVAELSKCPVIFGNSGSAVVNKSNKVVGIIFSSTNNKVRRPTDELNVRVSGNNSAFAFTVHQMKSILKTQLSKEGIN